MKTCLLCLRRLFIEEFYASSNKGHKDGYNPYCKQCCKVNRALENVRARDKESKVSYRQVYRARVELKVPYDSTITLEETFKAALGICAHCKKWVQPRHASMDHKIPLSWLESPGHVKSNVQLTHIKCNLIKGDRHDR